MAETDKALLHNAMDNSFPNMESFHRYFQQTYGHLPLDYREICRQMRQKDAKENHRLLGEVIERLTPSVRLAGDERQTLQIEMTDQRTYHAYWQELLHLEDMTLLDNGTITEHLHFVQETMHFRYAWVRAVCH